MFSCKKLLVSQEQGVLLDISFDIESSLALIGQSGSGKSLTLKSLLGLLPANLKKEMSIESSFELINGKTLCFVPQNPFTALSPLTKIRKQFFKQNATERLEEVGLEKNILDRYPPELSGGQLQRVLIAMALDEKTELLLLDEPTTALDSSTKESIIELLNRLKKRHNFKILFVSHDVKSVQKVCKEVAVIKEGRIVETGLMDMFLENQQTDYAKKLLQSSYANREFRQ